MHTGKFGTAINCMDGRVQIPVTNWMKDKYSLDYVDMITEPGPEKLMSQGSTEHLRSIKARVEISVNAHGSKVILVAAHHDCAGNPVSKEEHVRQVGQCLKLIKSWGLPVSDIIGVWINDQWKAEPIGGVR
ncbi:MAG: carbonic anhydrase [Dehalococcoidia bacterium]